MLDTEISFSPCHSIFHVWNMEWYGTVLWRFSKSRWGDLWLAIKQLKPTFYSIHVLKGEKQSSIFNIQWCSIIFNEFDILCLERKIFHLTKHQYSIFNQHKDSLSSSTAAFPFLPFQFHGSLRNTKPPLIWYWTNTKNLNQGAPQGA